MRGARNLHYRVALVASLFIGISATTGLLWAYAPYLYWQPGYMEKRAGSPALASDTPLLHPGELIARLSRANDEQFSGPVSAVSLRSEAGRPVYEVSFATSKSRLLVDASSGTPLGPLSKEFALQMARQYVDDGVEVDTAERVAPWEDRKGKRYESVWIVRFADDGATEVVFDELSGHLAEHSDNVRRFHFGVMKLHQFNFFGTHKVLSAVSGVPLLILLFSGLVLGWKRLRPRKRSAGP